MNDPGEIGRDIERLIDGELNDAEQQQLLRAFDAQPDTWRAVALGFVEAQWVRSELAGWNPTTVAAPTAQTSTSLSSPAAGLGRASQVMTALAALVATFAIGIAARHWWPAKTADPTGGSIVNTDPRSVGPHIGRPVDEPTPLQVQRAGAPRDETALRRVNLPLIPAERVDPRSLYNAPAITPELKAALQRMGHVVHEERRFYSVELKDGRRVLVPVNEIRVEFVGNKVIQ